MFFFGIFGIQDREKTIKEFESTICPRCGRLTRAELIEVYTYFHFFFIPLFQWNHRYYVTLRCCRAFYEVPKDYINELKQTSIIDFSRLKDLSYFNPNTCPRCGNNVNPNFNYCPFCGERLN
ncbi:zinc ribbon domain-containing protein [Thermovenabulum sp.]|uniref:zinc ribbon domain-containing protein n=1 Tax=Thermovenabulum sp. TaxID=3100335 RepID=UPI003C79B100